MAQQSLGFGSCGLVQSKHSRLSPSGWSFKSWVDGGGDFEIQIREGKVRGEGKMQKEGSRLPRRYLRQRSSHPGGKQYSACTATCQEPCFYIKTKTCMDFMKTIHPSCFATTTGTPAPPLGPDFSPFQQSPSLKSQVFTLQSIPTWA